MVIHTIKELEDFAETLRWRDGEDFATITVRVEVLRELTARPDDALRAELVEALATARDYVSDAAQGALTYEGSGDGFIAMAKEDLARIAKAGAA